MYIWWRRAGRGRRGRGVAERGAEELGPARGARERLVRERARAPVAEPAGDALPEPALSAAARAAPTSRPPRQ